MDFTPVSAGFVLDVEICLKQNILWEIGTCHIQFTEICFFLQRLGFFLCLKSLFFSMIVELLTAYNQNIWIYRAFPAVSHLQPCKIKTVILFFFNFFEDDAWTYSKLSMSGTVLRSGALNWSKSYQLAVVTLPHLGGKSTE